MADKWGIETMLAKVGRNGSSCCLQDIQELPINEEKQREIGILATEIT